MKSNNFDHIHLNNRAIINALSLLNKYRNNQEGGFRDRFEGALSKYLHVKHAFSCNSGTNGLHVALLSLGVKAGDEIITNPLNYNIGTFAAILQCGAKPILARITDNGIMDVNDIKKRISPRTKGIIPVHLSGFMEDLAELHVLKRKYNLFILEDSCQALGSKVLIKGEWRNAGTVGDIGVFSFGLWKLLTTVEGGGIVTNDDKLAGRIDALLGLGFYRGKEFLLGFNSRMDHLRASIGLGNLESIDSLIAERKQIWFQYFNVLANYQWLQVIKPMDSQSINYTSFIVRVRNEKIRVKLMKSLYHAGLDIQGDVKREKVNMFVGLNPNLEMTNSLKDFKKSHIRLSTEPKLQKGDIRQIIRCFEHINSEMPSDQV